MTNRTPAKDDPSSPFYRDPESIETHPVKLYRCAEIVIEVCKEHGLKLPTPAELTERGTYKKVEASNSFTVVYVDATRAQFRAAQLEWLSRMSISTLPTSKPAPKPSIFS